MGIDNRPNEASALLGTVDIADISATAAEMEKFGVHLEDDPSASGDQGVQALTILRGAPSDTAGTDADYQPFQTYGGALWIRPLGSTGPAGRQETVATAGVRVALTAANSPAGTRVRANDSNLGYVYVGSSDVSSTQGYRLTPCESIHIGSQYTHAIYIDASVSGDGVSYIIG